MDFLSSYHFIGIMLLLFVGLLGFYFYLRNPVGEDDE